MSVGTISFLAFQRSPRSFLWRKACFCRRVRDPLQQQRFLTSSSKEEEKVVIPPRIHREPTDILRALASTLGNDPTAAHYKYHDDPYLIPMSNVGKRTFALAKESGRKAALWIRDKHGKLFQHRVADPFIDAFAPRPVYDENSEVSEDILLREIETVSVSSAIMVYGLLEKKGEQISNATKQSLLELLCFYNCDDALSEDLIEERWFLQVGMRGQQQKKLWKDNGLAENVFHSMDPKDSAAYCTLLQGMTQYFQAERAWQLYEEMKEKRIPMDTESYNGLISRANFLRQGNDLRWQLIEELLTEMKNEGLEPNIGTLNAVLESLSTMGSMRATKDFSLQAIREFKDLGIEPSLASYYYLLLIFCKDRGPVSSILMDIMNHIEGKEFTIIHPKDIFFFICAMDVCRNHLHDKDLARRVNALLHTGNNYDLIGDSLKESVYYRHYFALLCQTEPIENFMAFYNTLVPNIYVPEPGVMEEVIRSIELNMAVEYLPQIWSDMVVFDHIERESLVVAVLSTMVKCPAPAESSLVEQFVTIAWSVWNKLEDDTDDRIKKWGWTGPMLGDIMTVCLRGGDFAKACKAMRKLNEEQTKIVGVPSIESLQFFLDACIEQKDKAMALVCVQYTTDVGYPEAAKQAAQLSGALDLEPSEVEKLNEIAGNAVLSEEARETAV